MKKYVRENILKKQESSGITLVVLIITIAVLLILVGTAVGIAVNGGGLFGKATDASDKWNIAVETAEEQTYDAWSKRNINTGVSSSNPTPQPTTATPTATSTATPTPTAIPAGITMTLDGVQVTGITQANFAQHLGKVVTNYAPTATTISYTPPAEGASVKNCTVSNTYRLFWIDWENKYGDGAGTIYLKADCPAATTDLTYDSINALDGAAATSKIEQLNPALYATGVTPPSNIWPGIKAVRWLTDTTVWTGLKTGLNSSIANKVNYVIGAPSFEMFLDSYNTHYGLTNGTMDTGSRTSSSSRTKLSYIYPFDSDNAGYAAGPSNNSRAVNGYGLYTSDYTVKTDNAIDSVYFPGANREYWLASPSAQAGRVMIIGGFNGGVVSACGTGGSISLCPIVSIQPDVQL